MMTHKRVYFVLIGQGSRERANDNQELSVIRMKVSTGTYTKAS